MILYLRTSAWTPQRRLLAGSVACAAVAAAGWWTLGGDRSPAVRMATAAVPADASPFSNAPARTTPQPVAAAPGIGSERSAVTTRADVRPARQAGSETSAPYTYIGQWVDNGVTRVVLGDRGRTVVVRVPGTVDANYQAVSIDDSKLVLRHVTLGVLHTISLAPGGHAAPAAPAPEMGFAPEASPAGHENAVSTMVAPGVHVTPMSAPAAPPPPQGYENTEEN